MGNAGYKGHEIKTEPEWIPNECDNNNNNNNNNDNNNTNGGK
jgi:hypothetical protein